MIIVGAGYTANILLRLYPDKVRATYGRSPNSRENHHIIDLDYGGTTRINIDGQIVLYSAPPQSNNALCDERLTRFIQLCDGIPQHMIYLSTTGMYTEANGGWVNEKSPVGLTSPQATLRLNAEKQITNHFEHVAICRLSGIYGEGRLPRRLLDLKLPLIHPDEAPYVNRIHVEDIAHSLVAIAHQQTTGIINFADNKSVTLTESHLFLAKKLNFPIPKLVSYEAAKHLYPKSMWRFFTNSKRIENHKLKTTLNLPLKYPDYKTGFNAILGL